MIKFFKVFLFILAISVFVLKDAKAQGDSKMVFCMDASVIALEAFEQKLENKKAKYPIVQDNNFRILIHQLYNVGYNAKTYESAMMKAHEICVRSKIWLNN